MIIGIDAASTALSIALVAPDGSLIGDDAWTSEQRQSAELLPRLLALLARTGRDLHETTLVAVGTGPGSFTGLRVAMALAKGLAVGLGRPLAGIDSLVAWLEADADAVAAVARAGAHDAYVLARDADAPAIADEETVRARLGRERVVAPPELATAFGLAAAVLPRAAATIARRALAERPDGDDVRTLEPRYLRPPRGLEPHASEEVRWL